MSKTDLESFTKLIKIYKWNNNIREIDVGFFTNYMNEHLCKKNKITKENLFFFKKNQDYKILYFDHDLGNVFSFSSSETSILDNKNKPKFEIVFVDRNLKDICFSGDDLIDKPDIVKFLYLNFNDIFIKSNSLRIKKILFKR